MVQKFERTSPNAYIKRDSNSTAAAAQHWQIGWTGLCHIMRTWKCFSTSTVNYCMVYRDHYRNGIAVGSMQRSKLASRLSNICFIRLTD